MKICYVIGTDGSGKTTLAKGLTKAISEAGGNAKYFYAQHIAVLLVPFRWFIKRTFTRRYSQTKDYPEYSAQKTSISQRFPFFARVYAFLWLADYTLITYLRLLSVLVRRPKLLIIDRFYLDTVVNISQLLGLSDHEMIQMGLSVSRLFPRSDLTLYLDVSEEVAYSRKDDIASIVYLRERRRRYHAMRAPFSFCTIDAELPFDQVLGEALGHTKHLYRGVTK